MIQLAVYLARHCEKDVKQSTGRRCHESVLHQHDAPFFDHLVPGSHIRTSPVREL